MIVATTFVVMLLCLLYLVTGLDLGAVMLLRAANWLFWSMVMNSKLSAGFAIIVASVLLVVVMHSFAFVFFDFLEDSDALEMGLLWHGRIPSPYARKIIVDYVKLWPDWMVRMKAGGEEQRKAWLLCADHVNSSSDGCEPAYNKDYESLMFTLRNADPTPRLVSLLATHYKATGNKDTLQKLTEIQGLDYQVPDITQDNSQDDRDIPLVAREAGADATSVLIGLSITNDGFIPKHVHSAISQCEKAVLLRRRADKKGAPKQS
jgi:hypothetical protein